MKYFISDFIAKSILAMLYLSICGLVFTGIDLASSPLLQTVIFEVDSLVVLFFWYKFLGSF